MVQKDEANKGNNGGCHKRYISYYKILLKHPWEFAQANPSFSQQSQQLNRCCCSTMWILFMLPHQQPNTLSTAHSWSFLLKPMGLLQFCRMFSNPHFKAGMSETGYQILLRASQTHTIHHFSVALLTVAQ